MPLFAQWHDDIPITESEPTCYTPYSGGWSIAGDAENVYLVWQENNSPYIRYYDFPIGYPPEAPVPGEGVSSGSEHGEDAVISIYGGAVHVDWWLNSTLYFRVNASSVWGSIITHGFSGYTSRYPAIADDASGNTHCVFNRIGNGYQVYYQRRDAGATSFSAPVLVYDPGTNRYASYPSICIDHYGYIHVVWTQDWEPYNVGYAVSFDGGATWSVSGIPSTVAYSEPLSVACNSSGHVYVAYTDRTTPRQIYVAAKTGAWGTPVEVSNSTFYCYYPSICCDPDDGVWVVWDDRRSPYLCKDEIFYNHLLQGKTEWDGDFPVTYADNFYSRRPQIAADDLGNIHVIWYDQRTDDYNIYYNWLDVSRTSYAPLDRFDLKMAQIVRPHSTEAPWEAFTPSCRIYNNQGYVVSAKVRCRITNLTGKKVVYNDVIGSYPLDPGLTQVSSFKPFTVESGIEYEALFVVEHPNDVNPSNNDMFVRVTNDGFVDVTPIDVDAPGVFQRGMFTPMAYFKERIGQFTKDVTLRSKIEDMSSFSALVYEDSIGEMDFYPKDSFYAVFTPTPLDINDGLYMITFWATYRESHGTIISHPPFELTFQYEGIAEQPVTGNFALEAVAPNPFVDNANVSFSLGHTADISLKVYDVTGKVVSTLASGTYTQGPHTVNWNASHVPAGIYFIRFVAPEFSTTRKVMVLK